MLRIVVLSWLLATAALSHGQRPDFRGNDPNSQRPQTTVTNDTLITKKFRYQYRSLGDLKTIYEDFDTSLRFVHRVEDIYRKSILRGNLGSEQSVFYETLYEHGELPGIRNGFTHYEDLIVGRRSMEIIDVNRALARINYAKGYSIANSNLDLGFYRRFHGNLLLNVQFARLSDDSWTGLQPNESSFMDIKWFQESDQKKRQSYLKFERATYDEVHSRGLVNSTTESSDIEYNRWYIEAGNDVVLGDSIPSISDPTLKTRLSMKKRDYIFSDPSAVDSEIAYYRYPIEGDTLKAFSKWTEFSLENELHKNLAGWKMVAAMNFKLIHVDQSGQSFSFFQVIPHTRITKQIKENVSMTAGLTASVLDMGGDLEVYSAWEMSRKRHLRLKASFGLLQPDFELRTYGVNAQALWDNAYERVKYFNMEGAWSIANGKITLEGKIGLIGDMVLLNDLSLPFQSGETILTSNVRMGTQLKVGSLQSDHTAFYQYINSRFIPRPYIGYNGSYSLPIPILQKRIGLMAVVDVHYIADFSVPSFNPVLGRFYNNGSTVRSGHILIVNPSLNFKIDRFFGFIKINNAANRLRSDVQYLVSDFPVYDFRIVAGFRWDLLD